MSNKLIVIWGSVIILLVGTVYFIGIKYKDELKYISLKEEVKDSVKEYIKRNDIKLPLEITSEELEENNYIKELKLDDKICAADITVDKKFLFYNYDIEFTCIDLKTNEE